MSLQREWTFPTERPQCFEIHRMDLPCTRFRLQYCSVLDRSFSLSQRVAAVCTIELRRLNLFLSCFARAEAMPPFLPRTACFAELRR